MTASDNSGLTLASTIPPELDPEPPHHGARSRIRTYFLTGLIVAGPVAITIYLVWSFVTWVDGACLPGEYRCTNLKVVVKINRGHVLPFLG